MTTCLSASPRVHLLAQIGPGLFCLRRTVDVDMDSIDVTSDSGVFLTSVQYDICFSRKEGNVLFNDALNTFYLRLYGVGHMVKDHLDSERGNPLPPHGLLFTINSKGSFICIIPQTG